MEIIPVTRDDLFDLEEIESAIFHEDAFGVFMLEQYISRSILYLKMLDKGKKDILGFCIVSEFNKEEFEDSFLNYYEIRKIPNNKKKINYKNYAHLVNLVVKKEYWGKGTGRALLDYIIKETSRMGYLYILLEVSQENERAINLYKSFGFDFNFIIENYYNSGANASVMILKI